MTFKICYTNKPHILNPRGREVDVHIFRFLEALFLELIFPPIFRSKTHGLDKLIVKS